MHVPLPVLPLLFFQSPKKLLILSKRSSTHNSAEKFNPEEFVGMEEVRGKELEEGVWCARGGPPIATAPPFPRSLLVIGHRKSITFYHLFSSAKLFNPFRPSGSRSKD